MSSLEPGDRDVAEGDNTGQSNLIQDIIDRQDKGKKIFRKKNVLLHLGRKAYNQQEDMGRFEKILDLIALADRHQ